MAARSSTSIVKCPATRPPIQGMNCEKRGAGFANLVTGITREATVRRTRCAGSVPVPIGTDEQFRWFEGILKAIVVMNLLDAVFTLAWIQSGLAIEANAFIRDLAHGDALGFMLAKIALVSLGALMLWRYRHRPLAVVATFGAFLAYYLVLLHHLQFSSVLMVGLTGK